MLVLFVVGAAVTLLRVPAEHIDTIWAEDGEQFLREHVRDSAWTSIFKSYAGYQHLIPRLVTALLTSVLPLDAMGVAIFVACAILTGAVAAAVFWLSRDLVPWMPARFALAGITVLLPLSSVEVSGNLADFHSYCLWLMPWLLLYRPRGLGSGIGWGIVALLSAMTEIQALLFVPLLLLMLRREHRFAWPIGAGFVLGMLVQLTSTLIAPRDSTAAWQGIPSLVLGYLYNTVLPMLSPDVGWELNAVAMSGALVPALALIPFAAATIVVLVWGTGMQRLLVITLVIASVTVSAAAVTIDGGEYFRYADHTNSDGFEGLLIVRYGVASGFFLAGTVPLAAAVLVRVATARSVRWPKAVAWIAVVGLLLQFAIASTQAPSARGSGVSWSGNIAEARELCEKFSFAEPLHVDIAPERVVRVGCDDLLPAD